MRLSVVFHVEVRSGDSVKTFRYKRKELAIGRREDNDLVLPHDSVAERHCIVMPEGGGQFYLVSMPLQPTSVNGREVTRFYDGDAVTLGAYRLVFRTGDRKPEEAEFLRSLGENPSDEATRVVYADWLEEERRTHEARFLRDESVEPGYIHGTIPWRRLVSKTPLERCGYHFEYLCPKKWSELSPTDRADQRHCGTCDKNVHYTATVSDARELVREGHCIAVDLGEVRSKNDLEPPSTEHVMMGVVRRID